MLEELLTKIVEELLLKIKNPTDLVFMIIACSLGITMTRLYLKYKQKPEAVKNEKGEKIIICPLTGEEAPCQKLPTITFELANLSNDCLDMKIRVSKLLNIVSKEWEGKWDRYLFDKDTDPKDILELHAKVEESRRKKKEI